MAFYFKKILFLISILCLSPLLGRDTKKSNIKKTNNTKNKKIIDLEKIDREKTCITSENFSPKRVVEIRVLLDQQVFKKNNLSQKDLKENKAQQEAHKTWVIGSRLGLTVYNQDNLVKIAQGKKITLSTTNGSLYINGTVCPHNRLTIVAENKHITYDTNVYHGTFNLCVDNNKLLLINTLELEDYIYSVLKTESWPGWSLEVNKVFAIACRSYVLGLMRESRVKKRPYHVCNTNSHQTYTGAHSNKLLKEAVENTLGQFLSYNNKPIIAMFDCCCGGVVPAHIEGVDFGGAPYLARNYACTYCKSCKLYNWEAEYQLTDIKKLLDDRGHSIKKLTDIKVLKKDKAGCVRQVSLKNGRLSHAIPGKRLYSLLKQVKSFCFNARKRAGKIIFTGRGYGHHMGLCQWGARQMVENGSTYQHVLSFYYPDTQLMKLC